MGGPRKTQAQFSNFFGPITATFCFPLAQSCVSPTYPMARAALLARAPAKVGVYDMWQPSSD